MKGRKVFIGGLDMCSFGRSGRGHIPPEDVIRNVSERSHRHFCL